MTFEKALELMKKGEKISRKAWGYNGNNIYIAMNFGDEKYTIPHIYMYKEFETENKIEKRIFPMELSCESIFAEDWEVIE